MMLNAPVIDALRTAGHNAGRIHANDDGTRTVRLPGDPSITAVGEAAAAIAATGVEIVSCAAHMPSPHDDAICGSIRFRAA